MISRSMMVVVMKGVKVRKDRLLMRRIKSSFCGVYVIDESGLFVKIGSVKCLGRSCFFSLLEGRGFLMN